MANHKAFKRAVAIAVQHGWNPLGLQPQAVDGHGEYIPQVLLFNHDFAKALWGECTTWVKSKHGTVDHIPLNGYQYHLQKMVIADDPIKYLAEHLPME